MADFASNIIGALSASRTTRAKDAQTVLSEFDANGDGKVTGQEFQKVFAVLQRTQDMGGGHGAGQSAGFHATGVRPTIFECTLYPSFSKNFGLSQYQAVEMLGSFDKNKDKVVTLDELSGVDSSKPVTNPTTDPVTPPPPPPPPPDQPPPSPAERADALMAQYDKTQ